MEEISLPRWAWIYGMAAALCLLPASPWAQVVIPVAPGQFEDANKAVSNLDEVLVDASAPEEHVSAAASTLFAGLTAGRVRTRLELHPYTLMQEAPPPEKPLSLKDIITTARQTPKNAYRVPSPIVAQAQSDLGDLDSAGLIGEDSSMSRQEMGLYKYLQGSSARGTLWINGILPDLTPLVGPYVAASVAIHEAIHDLQHTAGQLDQLGESVEAELPAWLGQIDYLLQRKSIREELGTRHLQLLMAMKRDPNPKTAAAISLISSLEAFIGLPTDEARKALIERIYGIGPSNHAAAGISSA